MKVDGGESKKKGYKAEIEISNRQSRGGVYNRRAIKRKVYTGHPYKTVGALITLGTYLFGLKKK